MSDEDLIDLWGVSPDIIEWNKKFLRYEDYVHLKWSNKREEARKAFQKLKKLDLEVTWKSGPDEVGGARKSVIASSFEV